MGVAPRYLGRTDAPGRRSREHPGPKSGSAARAFGVASPPWPPLRAAVGRLRTSRCPLHPNGSRARIVDRGRRPL